MSNAKDFLKEMLAVHPELHAFYDTEQYQLSEQIIECMVRSCLTEEQMANQLGLDLNYFFRLASGDNTIEVSAYKEIIQQCKSWD